MENKVYIDPYPKTMKMLGLERINIDCGNNTSIVTPANIAKDMVALLPDEVFIPESKFLDICCKSGIFLTSIREKLMNSKAMIESFPDDKERYQYITNNQLYGIAPNGQCQMYSVRAVYGTLKVDNPHILCFGVFDQYKTACLNNNHKMLIDEMKKEFGQMRFDVVIGNPPYNKDIYLDFVTLGHTLASKYDCWITPAKWQAKGGAKNEDFRKNIVPYMSKIVYYPYTKDVFAVTVGGGITYYIINTKRNLDAQQLLELKSIDPKVIFKNEIIYVNRYRKTYFNNIYENIVSKVIDRRKQLTIGDYEEAPYYVEVSHLSADKDKSNCMGGLVTTPFYKSKSISNIQNIHTIFSGTEEQCNSFISFVNTKTVRFLIMLSLYVPIINNICWRFVPAPKAFDHIFTDQELYEEYKLTPEEINIIESVIKERK